MLRNEKGFAFPVSLSILLASCLSLLILLGQNVSEAELLNEKEQILKQDYYLLSSVKRLERHLADVEEDETLQLGSFIFKEGTVTYSMTELAGSLFEISFTLAIESQKPIVSYAFYDRDRGKMIKWTEKK
ncbi:competence type IV pilus minor pilin ComGG [Bacillus sp. MMSF_3328]|uniref:competence type IV pilus minor pilin ComGG n=1 Tax=Bacillus sp. MMSF_3328 TaxID=3047080 RepID=UPI00273E3E37|nr:competence type IV pilus minor pilin ComGG [Bacillus sp. MMSF_3328]